MSKFRYALLVLLIASSVSYAKSPKWQSIPPVVQVVTAKSQSWQQQIQATGSLSALEGIVVKPEIAGRVTQIYFKSGQDVKQGAKLVALDQEILQAQLSSNQATEILREQQFKRAIELYKLHALSKADYDTARANLISAKATVEQSQAQLQEATIVAPFSGRLGLREVSLGDYLNAGEAIVNLQKLDPLIVNFSIPEVYLNQIAVGNSVQIHSDAFPNQMYVGKVYAADSVVDPNTRTLAMRATVPNPDKQLLPGTFVEVSLMLGKSQNVIAIPQTALLSALDGAFVYKIINNKAIKTPVTVSSRNDQTAFISQGLKAGDVVVSDGGMKITQNNSIVQIAPTA